MASLDQHGDTGRGRQPLTLFDGLCPVARKRFRQQHGQFGQVGRDQIHEGNQVTQRLLRRGIKESISAGRHHHRVEHDERRSAGFEPGTHLADHVDIREHPDLDGVDDYVVAHRIQLLS